MFVHGKNTFWSVNGNNLSGHGDSTDITDGVAIHKTTTYGPTRTRESKAAGLGDGKITVKGTYDDGQTSPRKVLKPLMDAGTSVPYLFRHKGTGSGLPQLSVNVIVAAYNESSPANDMIKWTAELEMDGDRSDADQP